MWTWKAEDVSHPAFVLMELCLMSLLGCGLDLPGRPERRLDPAEPYGPQIPQHLRLSWLSGLEHSNLDILLGTILERHIHEPVLVPCIPSHVCRTYIRFVYTHTCSLSLFIPSGCQ